MGRQGANLTWQTIYDSATLNVAVDGHALQTAVTGVNGAKQMGLTPTGVAASRAICPSCAQFLKGVGVSMLSIFKNSPM